MSPLQWINEKVLSSPKLEYIVKKYGPDFLSTYGGGALIGVGTALVGQGTGIEYAAIPAAAGLVSFVNQLDHEYKEQAYVEFYRDQIAALRHKKPKDVTPEDLRAIAECAPGDACGNAVIRGNVEYNDWRRTVDIALHGASAAVFGIVAWAVTPWLQQSGFTDLGVAQAGVGIGSLLVFQQIDNVVSDIGRVVLNVNRPTAHDGILQLQETLHKGQQVSPLQVFAVIVNADRDMQKAIDTEYGCSFENLYLSDKLAAMEKFGSKHAVKQLAEALNTGKYEAEDIVLILCGQPPAPKTHERAERSAMQSGKESMAQDMVAGLVGTAEKGATFFQDKVARLADGADLSGLTSRILH